MNPAKILLVDDHTIVRDGIKAILTASQKFSINDEASSAKEAYAKLKEQKFDIVLLDVHMSETDGISATSTIKQQYPNVNIIVLSMEVNVDIVSRAMQAGASTFLPKDCKKEELIEAIHTIHQGERYVCNSVSNMIFTQFMKNSSDSRFNSRISKTKSSEGTISEREEEVLKLLASGCTNKQTAEKLFISVRTVDSHRNHIMKKLNINNTADLVKYALKKNLISLE